MGGWADFWRIVLYGALGLFTAMSLWVIVFGYRDIRKMFASLREQPDDGEE
jgi:hypothetical protein